MKNALRLSLLLLLFIPFCGISQEYVKLNSGKKVAGKVKIKGKEVQVKMPNGNKQSIAFENIDHIRIKDEKIVYVTYEDKKGEESSGLFTVDQDGPIQLLSDENTYVVMRTISSPGTGPIATTHNTIRVLIGGNDQGYSLYYGHLGLSNDYQKEILLKYMGDNPEVVQKINAKEKDYLKGYYSKMKPKLQELIALYNKTASNNISDEEK